MDDLISRKAAIAIMQAKGDIAMGTPGVVFYGAANMLERMPAVDAEPVRHGKWERNDALTRYDEGMYCVNYYDCNKCGYTISDRHGLYRYCPDCGAKMDMEKEDE